MPSPEAQDYAKLGFAITEAKQEFCDRRMGRSDDFGRGRARLSMSALGQKQAFAPQNGMSA
jgi:hypothetical protein